MKFKVHYSLIIVLVLSLFTGQLIPFTIFFISIVLHELSHLLTAKIYNQKFISLTLTAIGGVVEMRIKKISKIHLLIVQMSGVTTNFLIYLLFKNLPTFQYTDIILNFNCLLIIFNLLPIYPLDGHLILKSILSFFCSYSKEYYVSTFVSGLFVIIFTIYSIQTLSIAIIIIAIFLIHKNLLLIVQKDYFILQKIMMQT